MTKQEQDLKILMNKKKSEDGIEENTKEEIKDGNHKTEGDGDESKKMLDDNETWTDDLDNQLNNITLSCNNEMEAQEFLENGKSFDIEISNGNKTVSRFTIWINLLLLSFSFLISFSAFNSYSNLQSSINIEGGLGTTGLCLIYSTMVLTNLFITPITASRFGQKQIMVVCMSTYMVFVATGFLATWATVIPASVIIGLGKYYNNVAFINVQSCAYSWWQS